MRGFISKWNNALGEGAILTETGLVFTFTRSVCSPKLQTLLDDIGYDYGISASPLRVSFEIRIAADGTAQVVNVESDETGAARGSITIGGMNIGRDIVGRNIYVTGNISGIPQGAKKEDFEKESGSKRKERRVRVFYATDRSPKAGDVNRGYAGGRNAKGALEVGSCIVSIPRNHKLGRLESPSIFKLQFTPNPKKHITLLSINKTTKTTFYHQISNRVSKSEGRELFVFIHGYNVSFKDAARRTAQIAVDLNFDGAPIFYSWPSAARVTAYPKDATNIEWTIPHLRQFLIELSERSSATTIHLIAHSMGNRALVEVLKDWGYQGEPKAPFRHVVLTAPDIDAETFKGLALAMASKAHKITVYSSHLDKALLASKKFNGYARAGETIVIIKGIDTIDASAVNTTFWGHSHFGDSRSVLQDIYWLFKDFPPEKRHGMKRAMAADGLYYAFRP